MLTVLRIERTEPRPGKTDHAYCYRGGYKLGNPALSSKQRKLSRNCKIVGTLEDAAHWIETEGWHIRMGDTWRDASLIEPTKVRIVRS